MAATSKKATQLSKAEYLKQYLSADGDKKSKEKVKKRRIKVVEKRIRIVDDDLDWKQMVAAEEKQREKENEEEEEDEAPVVAEVIDERPEEVKYLEAFRTSNKWKVLGDDDDEDGENTSDGSRHDSPESLPIKKTRHDSPELLSVKRIRHDSPEAQLVRKTQRDSSDTASPRRGRHDSPDLSPRRRQTVRLGPASPPANKQTGKDRTQHCRDSSPAGRKTSDQKPSPDSNQRPRSRHDSDQSPPRRRPQSGGGASDSDQSPPRKRPQKGDALDSDQSPPRRQRKSRWGSDSDQSPPRRPTKGGGNSDDDLSPPRRPGTSQGQRMLSGGAAGLVPIEVLRKEQEENRRRDGANQNLEDASRGAQTVFRDRSGKKRDLEAEREEQKKKAGEKAAKDEKYAQWGKGLVQSQMQQQNVEDALREFEKPLARHRDDVDLDRMLREQLRDGDPMAAMLRRKKERDNKMQGIKERPKYKGPAPPPNRFNIPPGYRWDGVDRSNGFEAKRYSRMADKKAVQDIAYKWSVEDM